MKAPPKTGKYTPEEPASSALHGEDDSPSTTGSEETSQVNMGANAVQLYVCITMQTSARQ